MFLRSAQSKLKCKYQKLKMDSSVGAALRRPQDTGEIPVPIPISIGRELAPTKIIPLSQYINY